MSSTQMNIRIDPVLKATGDSILRRNGYTPSAAIQAFWSYITEHQQLPAFMPKRKSPSLDEEKMREIEEGNGLAWRLLEEATGICVSPDSDDALDYDSLREQAYIERGLLYD